MNQSLEAQVEICLSIVKRAEREIRYAKQAIAVLRDMIDQQTPTAEKSAQGEQ